MVSRGMEAIAFVALQEVSSGLGLTGLIVIVWRCSRIARVVGSSSIRVICLLFFFFTVLRKVMSLLTHIVVFKGKTEKNIPYANLTAITCTCMYELCCEFNKEWQFFLEHYSVQNHLTQRVTMTCQYIMSGVAWALSFIYTQSAVHTRDAQRQC